MFTYLLKTLFFRVYMFFMHWYEGGGRVLYGMALAIMRRLDRWIGLRVNARFLFSPLYQERNVMGYALGFIVRSSRLTLGALLLALAYALLGFVGVVWMCIPPYLIIKIIIG